MCMGNSHKHENSKDREAMLGICDISDEGERGGMESGRLTGGGGRAAHTGQAEPCWPLETVGPGVSSPDAWRLPD